MGLQSEEYFKMNKIIDKKIISILIILSATFLIIQFTDTIEKKSILQPLANFPKQIGEWKLVNDRGLSENTINMLGVDEFINYDYRSPDGDTVNVYISYFGALGVTGIYHSPLNCMPGGGTKILEIDTFQLNNAKKIKKLKLSFNNQINDAYYWYYNRGRTIQSEYMEKIYLVLDAVSKGRRDGSFIRIVTYSKNNSEESNKKIVEFVNEIAQISTQYIPGRQAD